MSITVNFRTAAAVVTTRRFEPGQGISIFGKVSGALGFGAANSHVRLTVSGDGINFFQEQRSNFWGDFAFFIRLPETVAGQAEIKITSSYIIGQEETIVPIAWGTAVPAPPPAPPKSPDPIGSVVDAGKDLLSAVKWVVIGAVVIGIGYLAFNFKRIFK